MRGNTTRLRAEAVPSALEEIDPVDLVARQLVSGAGHPSGLTCRLLPYDGGDDGEVTLLDEDGNGFLIPAESLYAARVAGLAALACRLLPVGVITAAVLGAGVDVQVALAVLARHVPGISHVALCDATGTTIPPALLDQLHLAGIGLSVTADAEEAVLGANLVVVVASAAAGSELHRLARGAVLVNAAGRLRDELVAGVSQIYVDDVTLLGSVPSRSVLTPAKVAAGLGQVITGDHPGRASVDDVLLVELLGARELDLSLADALRRAALLRGLCEQVEPEDAFD